MKPKEGKMMLSAVIFLCVQIAPKCNFKIYLLPVSFPGESLPLSTGNQITIKFTTVGPETAKGFHFVYQGQFSALSKIYVFIFTLFIKTIDNIFDTSWSFHIWISKHNYIVIMYNNIYIYIYFSAVE